MRIAARERLVPMLVLGAAAAAAPAVLIGLVGRRTVHVDGAVHFFAVGVTAFAAAAAAVALSIVGSRFRDTRTVLVGTAFGTMAALLALHGLATPDFIFGHNGVVTFTGGATLPVGAAILTLSVVPLPRPLRGTRPLLVLEAVLMTSIVALGLAALAWPDLVPAVPAANTLPAHLLLGTGLALFLVLTLRALRTFLLTHRAADLVVTVGLVWLATSLFAALTTTWAQLGWWFGHALELDAILLVGVAVALDLARTAQSRPLAGDLDAVDLVLEEELFLGSHVRALTVELAQRDASTEQHTRRVALRAVEVGKELGLSTRRLRTLAIGGLVHDIGKLSVPDAILKKPGPLDDGEYAVVKLHTEAGRRLLEKIGGFTHGVLRLVHEHHERPDGLGYPRGLRDDEINLDTRILSVCDVYDALVSTRVYRPAWSHEQAMELLRDECAFDRRCVEALEAVLVREEIRAVRPELARAARMVAAIAGARA